MPIPNVVRTSLVLLPDPSRVLLRPFMPGDSERARAIIGRVLTIPEADAASLLETVMSGFSTRHARLPGLLRERFQQVSGLIPPGAVLSDARQLLIGSYFMNEYSVESAALFNPSLVAHWNQAGLPAGALRVILSLRATGEGHISSITFRSAIIHADHRIELARPNALLTEARQVPNPVYERALFAERLHETGVTGEFVESLIGRLEERFSLAELRAVIDASLRDQHQSRGLLHADKTAADSVWSLARSNYEVRFEPDQHLSERILFPATASQRNGIEDARFVRFRGENGTSVYYATFTAFDGRVAMPELVETEEFTQFRFITLNGQAAQNKGMALFPRLIDGRFAMLSRQDGESISIMFSRNVHFWNDRQLLMQPDAPWELVQIGNCGSPIETPAGWLVLSHGVGPMRRYCIGAFLLDLHDPTRVIGRLREPLLEPGPSEREGYVPNVVYSCGSIVHNGVLIIPYGLSDRSTGFASVSLTEVLSAMVSS